MRKLTNWLSRKRPISGLMRQSPVFIRPLEMPFSASAATSDPTARGAPRRLVFGLKEIEGGSPKRAGEVGLPETLRRAPHPTRPRNGPQSDELRAKGVGMGVIQSAALT